MECAISNKTKIANALQSIKNVSENELSAEEAVNNFLDKIIVFKEKQSRLNNGLEELLVACSSLTWNTDYLDDDIATIKKIIQRLLELKPRLNRYFASLADYRKKGIAKEEIREFKALIGDITEIADDLDARFFRLPENLEFQALNKQLLDL